MKVDIYSPPEPLSFGDGDDAFQLMLRKFTGSDVANIIDAMTQGSLDGIREAVCRLVIGWSGVLGSNGQKIPFEELKDGKTVRNLDAFLGAAGPRVQVEVVQGIVAFVGIPTADLDGLRRAFESSPTKPPKGGDSKQSAGNVQKPEGDTPTTASGD